MRSISSALSWKYESSQNASTLRVWYPIWPMATSICFDHSTSTRLWRAVSLTPMTQKNLPA